MSGLRFNSYVTINNVVLCSVSQERNPQKCCLMSGLRFNSYVTIKNVVLRLVSQERHHQECCLTVCLVSPFSNPKKLICLLISGSYTIGQEPTEANVHVLHL
jgi:hypothetical protein